MQKTICELFAGVGGFRLGFDRLESGWKTTWFSQWEPGARTQWAHNCYVQHFGDSPDLNNEFHTGEDISAMDKQAIPDHTLLVGGFPCQDYRASYALSTSKLNSHFPFSPEPVNVETPSKGLFNLNGR